MDDKYSFIKNVLKNIGNDSKDIDTVLENCNGDISLANLMKMLKELEEKKRSKTFFEDDDYMEEAFKHSQTELPQNSNVIIISSDSDDDDDDDPMIPFSNNGSKTFNQHNNDNFSKMTRQQHTSAHSQQSKIEMSTIHKPEMSQVTLKSTAGVSEKMEIPTEHFVQQASNTTASTSSTKCSNEHMPDNQMDENEIALQTAYLDMPSVNDMRAWFAKHFSLESDDSISGTDLFADFCKYFSLPNYSALCEVFTSEFQREVLSEPKYVDAIVKLNDSGKIEKVYKVQAVSKIKPVNHKVPSESGIIKDWLNSTISSHDQPSPSKIDLTVPSLSKNEIDRRNHSSSQNPSNLSQSKTIHAKNTQDREVCDKQFSKLPASANDSTMSNEIHHSFQPSSSKSLHSEFSGSPHSNAIFGKSIQPHHSKYQSTRELLLLPQTNGNDTLRPIVIDGSNVACSHGNNGIFSCRGIAICVRYFWMRGHRNITCFVPNYRKKKVGRPRITDQEVLFNLEEQNICKFTPSRQVSGKEMTCYDDRFILRLAVENDGIIVSNDQYRDLKCERKEWARVIDHRLLMFTFVQDFFMPPDDPLGRNGPSLDQFLSFPNGNAAKYGTALVKQDFNHQEPVLPVQSNKALNNRKHQMSYENRSAKTHSKPTSNHHEGVEKKLISLFPDREQRIKQLITMHYAVKDPDILTNLIIDLVADA